MDAIRRERQRLLRRTATVYGGALAVTAFVCLATQAPAESPALLASAPLFLLLGVAVWLVGTRWAWAGVVSGAVIVIAIGVVLRLLTTPLLGGLPLPPPMIITIVVLTGGVTPAIAIALLATRRGVIAFAAAGAVSTTAAVLLLIGVQRPLVPLAGQAFGWAVAIVIGAAIVAAVPPAIEQIARIGRAHRAERDASELEAQRRQGARLLHDTVLATLTLLAHSGIGVPEELLRAQARDDARLLRQLRLGEALTPSSGAPYAPEPVEDTTLAETLEAVRRRFEQMGLEVTLHGVGRVLLPQHVLDAFLLAVGECLENVRRHSGSPIAHVTITEDKEAVRAMITDAGTGFDVTGVADGRLGIKESVHGRLAAVGGHARLFSTPGAGTTVLLEVPR